jgi:glutamyl-tRNA synthetase
VLPYFQDELAYDPAACAKFLKDGALPAHLEALQERYRALPDFTKEALEAELRALADQGGIKPAVLIHPTRMALSAATGGPPLFDLVELVGRETTDQRLGRFLAFLREAGNTARAAEG